MTDSTHSTTETTAPGSRLTEVARLFLRLGFTAFGGPAAHIAMMHDEVVERRRWLDDQGFLDLIGATSLIPTPIFGGGLRSLREKSILSANVRRTSKVYTSEEEQMDYGPGYPITL